MSSEWLTAESFERNHRLLSAINTLSIRAKLALAGTTDAPSVGNISEAKEELKHFLIRMGPLVHDVEMNQEAPLLGADSRLSSLVRQYATSRKRHASVLYKTPIERVVTLLDSEQAADRERLIEYLTALRQLVEQHTYADVVGLLGEV
jgi:hypothetical protein